MAKPTKELNILGILKEAINLSHTNWNLLLSIVLLFLLPCKLLLMAITEFNPIPLRFDLSSLASQATSPFEVELVGSALWWLFSTVVIYLLSKAYIKKPSSLAELWSTARREWKKIFITSFYRELISSTYSYLLLALNHLIPINIKKGATLLVILNNVSILAAMVIGLVMFVFVILVCESSLVVSTVEEVCYGLAALQRAAKIIRGRKLKAFVLISLLILVDQVLMDGDFEKKGSTVWRIAVIPIELVLQLVACSVYSVLYLESKKRLGREEEDERSV